VSGFGACRILMYNLFIRFAVVNNYLIDMSIKKYLGLSWQMHLCLLTFECIFLDSAGKIKYTYII